MNDYDSRLKNYQGKINLGADRLCVFPKTQRSMKQG